MNAWINQHKKDLLRLHWIVFIYGFTAILGKLIQLDSVTLVWYRMGLAALFLGIYAIINKHLFKFSIIGLLSLYGTGILVAIHWITFFGAIKASNVSVALGCFASTTLFTALLEPLFFKRKISFIEVIIGIIIIVGLYLIFQFEFQYIIGISLSLISALLASLFTIINKKLINNHHPLEISVVEIAAGFIGITIWFLATNKINSSFPLPSLNDWFYLVILSSICTAYAFVVSTDVMKSLSAYTVVLTVNLEPVYAIVLAYFIFGETEHMSYGFYIGTLIILLAVFIYPIWQKHQLKKAPIIT